MALHTSYILIVLKHILNLLLNNFFCGPVTTMYVPGPSIDYAGWPNIVEDLGLIKLSTTDPLELP